MQGVEPVEELTAEQVDALAGADILGFPSVQGVEPVEELTAEQVDALAGGRTLRQQALHQAPPGRVNERMSGRLAAALTQARAPSLHFTGF